VNFIDKQNNLSRRPGDFVQDRLQALFKFTPVFGTGNQGTHVERNNPLFLQAVRNVTGDNAAGQPLHDGGFPDSRLTDQYRVILGPAGKHLDRAADFPVTPDNRVELVLLGQAGEVAPVFFQGLVGGFRIGAADTLVAPHFGQGGEEFVAIEPAGFKGLGHPR
jgi:hypothetical protein